MYKILANTLFLGKDIQYLPECHSTNDMAFQLVRNKKAQEGTVIICDHQQAGKGQRGNQWESEPGKNLTFSLILKPAFLDASEQFYLNMAVSCAIRKVLTDYFPLIQIKWPNDLIVPQSGKIGGVLIENSIGKSGWEVAVVGIGLNINQTDFGSEKAVSLKNLTSLDYSLQELLRQLVTQLEQYYLALRKRKFAQIHTDYLSHLFLYQEWATYEAEGDFFEGKIIAVQADGKLELELKGGSKQSFGFQAIRFPDYSRRF